MLGHWLQGYLHLDAPRERLGVRLFTLLVGGLLIAAAVWWIPRDQTDTIEWVANAAALWLGAPVVGLAVSNLRRGQMLVRELVVLAVLGAFVSGDPILAAIIAMIVIITAALEAYIARLARQGVESLSKLAPPTARRIEDGIEREVESVSLVRGDIIRVYPGETLPATGTLRTGEGRFDEARITGNPQFVSHQAGDTLAGGSVNLDRVIEVDVASTGVQAVLAQAGRALAAAEEGAVPLAAAFNRYAAWYTPIILFVTAAVLLLTPDETGDKWDRAIAMLLVACPSALLMAVPTAMAAALSAAARVGVVVQDPSSIDRARYVSATVFDSTGRFSPAQMQVSHIRTAPGVDENDVLTAAASALQDDDGIVGRALLQTCRHRALTLPECADLQRFAQRGLRATVGRKMLLMGTPSWLHAQLRSVLTDEADAVFDEAELLHRRQGMMLLMVVHGGSLQGWIALEEDATAASQAVQNLRRQGVSHIAMVSREHSKAAEYAAERMEAAYSEQSEAKEKLDIVADLEDRGHRVIVIGDGSRDTSANRNSALSVAMGATLGEQVGDSDVTLLGMDLSRLPVLLQLARRVRTALYQNFVLGGIVLAVMVALAAVGLISPIQAAILNGAGSLIVLFNAARIGGSTGRMLVRDAKAETGDQSNSEPNPPDAPLEESTQPV